MYVCVCLEVGVGARERSKRGLSLKICAIGIQLIVQKHKLKWVLRKVACNKS